MLERGALASDYSTEQILRDLSWIFTSPALIETTPLTFDNARLDQDWLDELASTPNRLYDFMENKNLKMLGPYLEALWEFYLLSYPGKKLIAKNLQVFGSTQTIGEFDFIYLDESTDEYFHLEVAIKYYLGIEEPEDSLAYNSCNSDNNSHSCMQNWLGPSTRDRFDKKYKKMIDHQSQLSRTLEAKSSLQSLGIKKIKPEVCMLGYFFYPAKLSNFKEMILPPTNSHVKHNRGCWVRFSQLEALLLEQEFWAVRNKPHWLAPVMKRKRELSTSNEMILALNEHFVMCQRPVLISSFNQGEHGLFESDLMLFVVPDSWPNKAG